MALTNVAVKNAKAGEKDYKLYDENPRLHSVMQRSFPANPQVQNDD
jgi:hypothetical protein